jgi:YidC/Oxa1 family membrane protein insertase
MKNSENNNLYLTIILSIMIMGLWQYFYEAPRLERLNQDKEIIKEINIAEDAKVSKELILDQEITDNGDFITVDSPKLSGKIFLKGLNFGSLTLKDYKQTVLPDSKEVILLNRTNHNLQYFTEFGWVARNPNYEPPTRSTIWTADNTILTIDNPVTFSWLNKNNVLFKTTVSIDKNYMFNIDSSIVNNSDRDVSFAPYGLIYRSLPELKETISVVHEGGVGVFNDILKEITLKDLIEKKVETFDSEKNGWLGFSDKYWLTALIPENNSKFTSNFSGGHKNNYLKFQLDFTGIEYLLQVGKTLTYNTKFFAGAKEEKIIDHYETKYDISLFDRSIDYGWFYFITKPMFKLLSFINKFTNNFGLAIIFMTLLVKLVMFPIAHKSYVSMQRMKKIQPQLAELKKLYKNDYIKLNNATMDLYKKEKLNPMSGCIPLFIQIPVFFSLYKVIYISIDMRHAPFYGWIKDLSMPDPTSLLNMFGLLDFTLPAILTIGAWPIIMGITMYLQQRLSPPPADPTQAKVMKLLPFIFIFMFQSFPAGLMIYWSVSNLVTIVQQLAVKRLYK